MLSYLQLFGCLKNSCVLFNLLLCGIFLLLLFWLSKIFDTAITEIDVIEKWRKIWVVVPKWHKLSDLFPGLTKSRRVGVAICRELLGINNFQKFKSLFLIVDNQQGKKLNMQFYLTEMFWRYTEFFLNNSCSLRWEVLKEKKVGNSVGMCQFRNKAALLLHVNAAETEWL